MPSEQAGLVEATDFLISLSEKTTAEALAWTVVTQEEDEDDPMAARATTHLGDHYIVEIYRRNDSRHPNEPYYGFKLTHRGQVECDIGWLQLDAERLEAKWTAPSSLDGAVNRNNRGAFFLEKLWEAIEQDAEFGRGHVRAASALLSSEPS